MTTYEFLFTSARIENGKEEEKEGPVPSGKGFDYMVNAGLCLQILSPSPGQTLAAGSEVTVRAQVALACGCPAGAGGRYDYRRFQIRAGLSRNDGKLVGFDVAPGSGAGELTGEIAVMTAGEYLLTIEAYDPESGMAGRTKTAFWVR